ncbi:hypothetical protein FQZ97_1176150 [compost metagenome]
MNLAQQQDGLTGGTSADDHGQQVEGDIRVAAQAQVIRVLGVLRHQLGHQVQALGVDVAGSVTVVAADVVLLGGSTVQQAAGLHEELLDTDVGR